jgi:hypothetical protein
VRKISILFVISIISFSAISQNLSPELVSSSGTHFSNATYQLDWSLGECVTTTHSADNYVITQGFHQENYSISVGITDCNTSIDITVYPNPTTDFITINITSDNLKNVSNLRLTDTNGKVLLQEKVNEIETFLNFSEYASGVYFLSIKNNNQLITSYKIVKK